MSKKIIYLLSLLMALSLVFASCKKTTTNPSGGFLGEEPGNVKPPDLSSSGGLFEDENKLNEYSTKIIQSSEIAKYADKNYMRNPVVTVIDGSTVVIFYEIRWESPGSENDTALTGTNTVDIAYTVSTDAGMSFDTSTSYDYVGKKASSYKDSHGAPVVFYDKQNQKLVVVASAGIGLGVGSKGLGEGKSKLEYAVADVKDPKSIKFGSWKEITVNSGDISSSVQFEQFGTHAAKGVVTSDNKLLLPVVLGKFVNENGSWGNSRWGYVLFEGKTSDKGSTYEFTKAGTTVAMTVANGTKATRIVSGTGTSDYRYITVSDRGDPVKLYSGKGSATPNKTDINAGDGAAGTLIVKDWQGKTSYDPKTYATKFDANETTGTGKEQALLSHVEVLEKQLAIRLVNAEFTTQQGSSFIPDVAYKNNSKSSSLDILKDGTIVMAAEGGQVKQGVEDGVKRPFYINFFRFTQAHITSETGN